MSGVPSQEYAGLAGDAYADHKVGRHVPGVGEPVSINGVDYRVVEHANNAKTGYQGTIYERVQGGDIVVAHRGTEEIWKDAVVADGSMVTARTNPQADDAIALTGRALEYAREVGAKPGQKTPEVSVTGHSLGGTLAQVSAHHYDLRGETFNAYGAASLDRRIPDGANGRVVNHVMAADAVSAASPHYGEVRTYATEREMTVLQQSGYHDGRLKDLVTPDSPVLAAGRSLGSHKMENFLTEDANGNARTSVLQDPSTRERADTHSRSIENYRDDVQTLRRGVTMGARGPVGWIQDGVDYIRGPDKAGAPAAREAEERARQGGNEGASLKPGAGDRADASPQLGGVQNPQVAKLLEAARDGNADAMRTATQGLQQSDAGQAFQQRADNEAQVLAQREVAQQAAQQRDAQQQEVARSA